MDTTNPDQLFQNYQQTYNQILLEISTNSKGLFGTNMDIWDILAAIIMAAIVTAAVFGISWIAYYIVISLTTATLTSGITLSVSLLEWLKIKENRDSAMKQFEGLLIAPLFIEIKESISKISIKETHSKIKNTLVELFGNTKNLEQFIKN